MAQRSEIESALNGLLEIGRFGDYGPNGLRAEGRAEVRRAVAGVTSSRVPSDAVAAARAARCVSLERRFIAIVPAA